MCIVISFNIIEYLLMNFLMKNKLFNNNKNDSFKLQNQKVIKIVGPNFFILKQTFQSRLP